MTEINVNQLPAQAPADGEIKKKKLRRHKKLRAADVIGKIALLLGAIIILVPFWILLITSFKSPAEIMSADFTWWPKEFNLDGYINAFNFETAAITSNVLIGLGNTLLYTLPTTIIGLFVSGMSAYAFSKMHFKGREVLFGVLLLTMVMPGTVVLIPQYTIYSMIGWVGTPFPLMIPGMFGAAGTVFFLRQFMRGVPDEIVEAAEMDGLGKFRAYWMIMLPVCVPAFIAQFVLNFIGGYNDYLGPILFLGEGDPSRFTLQVVLSNMVSSQESETQKRMANAVVALVPLIILYLFSQNFIIDGISVSAVKG